MTDTIKQNYSIWNMDNYKHLSDVEYEAVIRWDAELSKARERDLSRIKNLIHEHIAASGRDGQYSKLMALYDEAIEAEEDLFGRCNRYAIAMAKNRPYEELALIAQFIPQSAESVKKIERKIKHLHITLFGTANEAKGKNTITPAMIERAKDYPIENLIDFNKGFALCLWHDDRKPSMHKHRSKNMVKCFSCGEHGDAITVYRKIHGATFPEAVKALQ